MSKRNKKKNKALVRFVTLILGFGFAGSFVAIALSGVFSQNNYSASSPQAALDPASVEEQIQLQVRGYEKVLEREPKNVTALEGLAQIYLQTEPEKAIPTLEKLVEYYPEQQQYASILEIVRQQEANQPTETEPTQPEKSE